MASKEAVTWQAHPLGAESGTNYLLKDGQRQDLTDGGCFGAVYMAIWDWCACELAIDVRFPALQTVDTLDRVLLEGAPAQDLLAALRERGLPELAATALLYEMI